MHGVLDREMVETWIYKMVWHDCITIRIWVESPQSRWEEWVILSNQLMAVVWDDAGFSVLLSSSPWYWMVLEGRRSDAYIHTHMGAFHVSHIYDICICELYVDINRCARVTRVLPRGTSCGDWQVAKDRRDLCLNLYLASVKETPQNMSNIRTWRLQICLNTWLSLCNAKNPHVNHVLLAFFLWDFHVVPLYL